MINKGGGRMRNLELYIHIPFCIQKCAYCDFLSAKVGRKEQDAYVEAMKRELESYKEMASIYQVSSIFVGGGTPSILSYHKIQEIFNKVQEVFHLASCPEITIEANPGTVTLDKLKGWKELGINRISFGLQSIHDEELKMLGRIHTYQDFLQSYSMAREVGFNNINIDLISAIPGQSVESWRETLKTVAQLEPEHISAYSLIIEEGTLFYERYKDRRDPMGYLSLPDEDDERKMYEETEVILNQYGFQRYEISNYAKLGRECKHNLGYWERTEYLGIGLGAATLIENTRYNITRDFSFYLENAGKSKEIFQEKEVLSTQDQMEEFMFLGLRKMNGVSKRQFAQQFQCPIEEQYGEVLEELELENLISIKGDRIALTKRGIDISNYVFQKFLLS